MPELGKLKHIDTGQVHIISVESQPVRPMSIETAIIHWDGDPYDGPYTVTPGEEQQVLFTENKTLSRDIVVAPIPAGYGRISFDGNVLTVW